MWRFVAASKINKSPAPGRLARRWLYLIHRWVGIGSCLLFAMWFASGLVMIYVPYPSLTRHERLAHLQPIEWPNVTSPAPRPGGLRSIALEMRDGHPVWRLTPWEGNPVAMSAEAGLPVAPVDAAMARRVATRFGHAPVSELERMGRDQWTVAGGFNRHRPLWKATLADDAGSVVYVSSSTGDVVQETTRSERFWNWLGSVPHWLYPTVIRQDNETWRQVVMWVSGPCIAAGVTGMWIGILRTRIGRRRFKGGRMTPYHGWMLWHHIAGLVGGLFLVTWIFSGWLSVDPGRLFHSEGISDTALRDYSGDVSPDRMMLEGLGNAVPGSVRIEVVSHAGSQMLIAARSSGDEVVLNPRTHQPFSMPPGQVAFYAPRLIPPAPVVRSDNLTAPDAYWYGAGDLPQLPVIRLRFGDAAATWIHIAPRTGEVIGSIDEKGRTYRWLFDLLHKWDVNALTMRRPLWDIVLWILSLLGLVTSVSGIWIGWKRLRLDRKCLDRPMGWLANEAVLRSASRSPVGRLQAAFARKPLVPLPPNLGRSCPVGRFRERTAGKRPRFGRLAVEHPSPRSVVHSIGAGSSMRCQPPASTAR